MGSSYSMKPKPFISLTSVILPVPCLEKWVSMSALVAIQAESWLAADCTRALEVPLEPRLVASIRVAWPVRRDLSGQTCGWPILRRAVMTGQLFRLTIAGKVSQVESRCRNLSHDGRRQPDVARSGLPRILGVVLAELGRASRAAWGPDLSCREDKGPGTRVERRLDLRCTVPGRW